MMDLAIQAGIYEITFQVIAGGSVRSRVKSEADEVTAAAIVDAGELALDDIASGTGDELGEVRDRLGAGGILTLSLQAPERGAKIKIAELLGRLITKAIRVSPRPANDILGPAGGRIQILWRGSGEICNDSEMREDRGGGDANRPGEVGKQFGGVSLKVVDADREAAALRHELIQPISVKQIDHLERIIRSALSTAPKDAESFADDVNRILDAYDLKIRIDGGFCVRLATNKGRGDRPYVQFQMVGGRRGFNSTIIKIVPAPRYGQNTRPEPNR